MCPLSVNKVHINVTVDICALFSSINERERKFFHLKFVVTYFDLHVIRVPWRNIENQCFILTKKIIHRLA